MTTPEWGEVSREFPDLFPSHYVPGGYGSRHAEVESDDEEAIIVLEEDTPRVEDLGEGSR